MAMRHPLCTASERCHHSECHHNGIDLHSTSAKIPSHGHYPLNLGFTTHLLAGCGHGGTRNSSTALSVHTWSVRPAAIAGVQGRHVLAEPGPLVDSGWGRG